PTSPEPQPHQPRTLTSAACRAPSADLCGQFGDSDAQLSVRGQRGRATQRSRSAGSRNAAIAIIEVAQVSVRACEHHRCDDARNTGARRRGRRRSDESATAAPLPALTTAELQLVVQQWLEGFTFGGIEAHGRAGGGIDLDDGAGRFGAYAVLRAPDLIADQQTRTADAPDPQFHVHRLLAVVQRSQVLDLLAGHQRSGVTGRAAAEDLGRGTTDRRGGAVAAGAVAAGPVAPERCDAGLLQ